MPRGEAEFVTVGAACALLGVSPNTLRSWGAAGKVSEYRHPLNNYRLFQKRELEGLKQRLAHPKLVVRKGRLKK